MGYLEQACKLDNIMLQKQLQIWHNPSHLTIVVLVQLTILENYLQLNSVESMYDISKSSKELLATQTVLVDVFWIVIYGVQLIHREYNALGSLPLLHTLH